MLSLNKVQLLGNITNDTTLENKGGFDICNFGVATNYKTKKGEEWTTEVDFHNVTAFGKTAENISKYTKKGDKIFLECKLKTDTWETPEGQKRSAVKIIVNDFVLLGSRDIAEKSTTTNTATPNEIITNSVAENMLNESTINVNDLPF